ncbi:cyclopropane fatty acyl phospholipid synthase [Devosia sp.]|uniref:cyclopropane fatty acyl phospholipid synthase n=1 Tax=Devosia sp. TaxID=1871048 RepID=UPI0035B2BC2A
MNSGPGRYFADILERAGIEIGGDRPFDIAVHDERLWGRVLSHGTLGFGEAYMDGWFDVEALDQFIARLLEIDIYAHLKPDLGLAVSYLRGRLLNLQRLRVSEVGEKHYDIGNDLYAAMLDKRLIYSCGYWQEAPTLDAAQEAKLDLICRKIGLAPGMKVLDIGSGWGGFLRFAAERYGIEGVGITISQQQAAFAEANKGSLPIETRLMDYLALEGRFDRIVSIGMFEHVGYKNYRAYFAKARALLAPDGLFLLHTIGNNFSSTHGDPWTEKYIFPNGMLPSIGQIGAALEKRFVMEDWHNFGADYDRTLMAWWANFDAAWPGLRDRYGDRFRRMWRFYLMSFAAMFRTRNLQLWQLVLSPAGVRGGYRRLS